MASVLKRDSIQHSGNTPQPVVFNVEDVQERARAYLKQVQAEAQALLENATAQAATIEEEAKQRGITAARERFDEEVAKAARKLSDQRCRSAIEACQTTVDQLGEETNQWLTSWRNQTVELAGMIAEKILRREMQRDEELLNVWLEEALDVMRDAREVRVLVNPDDFAVAGQFLQKLSKSIPQAGQAEIVPDPEVRLGGCIVRSSHGQLDQQMETQLRRLVEQLG